MKNGGSEFLHHSKSRLLTRFEIILKQNYYFLVCDKSDGVSRFVAVYMRGQLPFLRITASHRRFYRKRLYVHV